LRSQLAGEDHDKDGPQGRGYTALWYGDVIVVGRREEK